MIAPDAAIPQYASQLEAATNSVLGAPVTAWDTMPATTAPNPFVTSAQPANPYPLRAGALTPGPGLPTTTVAPSWVNGGYEKPQDAPTNRTAIVGFVFSMLGLSPIGLILSIKALRVARAHEEARLKPVGRVLARWGVTLSTIQLVLLVVVVSLAITVGEAIFPFLPPDLIPGLLSTVGL